ALRVKCRPFGRTDGVTRLTRDDLDGDAASGTADHGLALPHRLGNSQSESLAGRFLKHDRGRALEGVDLKVGRRGQEEDMDIGIVARSLPDLSQDGRTLRLIGSGAPRMHQPAVVPLLARPVGVDATDRVL